MSARLEISIQYGGPIDRSGPVGVFGFGVASRCAEGLQISGLDQSMARCGMSTMSTISKPRTSAGESWVVSHNDNTAGGKKCDVDADPPPPLRRIHGARNSPLA